MDEALNWLVRLQCASEQDTRDFEAWLGAAAENAEAYVEAEALWNGAPLHQAAVQLNHRHRTALRGRLRTHWKPLATAAVLLVGLLTFGNLPVRLQADHLTVVGERQRLQLDDGAQVLLNTNSAFANDLRDGRQVARLLQGEAYFRYRATALPRWSWKQAHCARRQRHRLRRALPRWRSASAGAAWRYRLAGRP